MYLLDIVFAAPLLWALFIGFKKGLIIELASIIALILGIYGAIKFSGFTAEYLTNSLNMSEQNMGILSFAITFIVIVVAVYLVGKVVETMVKLVALSMVNRIGGAIFSGLKVAMIISIILVTINGWNEKYNFLPDSIKNDSILFEPLTKLSPTIMPFLKDSDWIQKGLEKLNELKDESGLLEGLEKE